MDINVNTQLYKIDSYHDGEYNVITVLDVGLIKSYTFFVDGNTADKINAHCGNRLIFCGYSYKSKNTGKYICNLSSIKTDDGTVIYAYKR